MDTLDAILTRRSVRRFLPDKQIPHQTLVELIKAAQYAPSAHNKQPWEFLVIEDKAFLADLPKYQPWTTFAKGASAIIMVLGNTQESFHDEEQGWNFADIDCSLATQNLMLAAHAKGLGSTMCAIAPKPDLIKNFQDLLGLPVHIRPLCLVVLGYPEGAIKQPSDRFVEQKIHWHKW